VAAATIAGGTGQPRWRWTSASYSFTESEQTGVVLRYVVKQGENLYAYHEPETGPLLDGAPTPSSVNVNAAGHWSGFHPY
jgi:hypothetical protein